MKKVCSEHEVLYQDLIEVLETNRLETTCAFVSQHSISGQDGRGGLHIMTFEGKRVDLRWAVYHNGRESRITLVVVKPEGYAYPLKVEDEEVEVIEFQHINLRELAAAVRDLPRFIEEEFKQRDQGKRTWEYETLGEMKEIVGKVGISLAEWQESKSSKG